MNRAVRIVLTWVMLIAMPVQGMAAAAMLFCGPGHERMIQGLSSHAVAMASTHAEGSGHDGAGAGHGDHEHAVADSVAAGPSAGGESGGADGLYPHHGKFSCSACAACCLALALPASFELPEAVPAAHAMRSSLVVPVASHQPDGLDRPPRAVLA